MNRRHAGWVLMEVLAVTALVGMFAVAAAPLLSQVWDETRRWEAREEGFDRCWLAVRSLRARAHRARDARARGPVLQILEAGDWVAFEPPAPPDEASYSLRRMPGGGLLTYSLTCGERTWEGAALVGRDRGARW